MQGWSKSTVFAIWARYNCLHLLFFLSYQLVTTSAASPQVNPPHTVLCSAGAEVVDMQWRLSYYDTVITINLTRIMESVTTEIMVAEGITLSTTGTVFSSLQSTMTIGSSRGEHIWITSLCSYRRYHNGVEKNFRNETTFLAVLPYPSENTPPIIIASPIAPTTTSSPTQTASPTNINEESSTGSISPTPSSNTTETTDEPRGPSSQIIPDLIPSGEVDLNDVDEERELNIVLVLAGVLGVTSFTAVLLIICIIVLLLYIRSKRKCNKRIRDCDKDDIYDYANIGVAAGTESVCTREDDSLAMTINVSYDIPNVASLQ